MSKFGDLLRARGPFTSCQHQLANVHRWNDEFGWGFSDQDFAGLGEPPAWPTGRLQAVVLVPRLALTNSTAAMLWKIAARQQRGSYCPEGAAPETWISLTEPLERSLTWSTVDLAACWTPLKQVEESSQVVFYSLNPVREPELCAGLEVLAAAAHFPRWVSSMDGSTVPNVIMPGLLCRGPDIVAGSVPMLCFAQTEPCVGLSVFEPDEVDGNAALGVLLPAHR